MGQPNFAADHRLAPMLECTRPLRFMRLHANGKHKFVAYFTNE
ncbi:hypothetical protein ACVWY3_006892 [Bradyrhizobium sp. USDA 4486]